MAVSSYPLPAKAGTGLNRRLANVLLYSVGLVLGTFGMAGAPAAKTLAPLEVIAEGDAPFTMQLDAGSSDQRFASLGDIEPHLDRLQQRPAPYRKPVQAPVPAVSFRQRVKLYRPFVTQYARQYKLPPQLIFAVIEQESSFNPNARSAGNAVGLMQLVANKGGRAAYHYSERRAGTPTLQELQDPKTNIRLGTAYLRLLLDRHFDDIENEDVRIAVALAAYNWGPGNTRSLLQRVGMPDSVVAFEAQLALHAPTETQKFVSTITRRMPAYV